MVGLMYDCLSNPLGAVRLTFEKSLGSDSNPAATFDGKDWGAVDLFREFLFSNGGLSQVPLLTPASIQWLQPNTLVRFRGMIQDMLGNEFYVGAYKDGSVWRTNKFSDVSQFSMASSPDTRVWERRLLYCTPIPGQNSWTVPSSEVLRRLNADWTSQQREKRQRLDEETIDPMVSDDESQDSPSTKKMKENGHLTVSLPENSRTEETCSSNALVPNCDRNHLSCLVKIYDTPESELKLNDVFEFVGVLMFDSEVAADKDDTDEFSEDVLTQLPSSKVPRLHCLVHRKLSGCDFIGSAPIMEIKSDVFKEIRETLLGHLTAVLGNDTIAAHFVLLHLLSRVHARADTVAVGKLSLNLTNLNKESASIFVNQLSLLIKNVQPFTHCIPLTIEYLNSAQLAPRKDYQTNRLTTGVLQLAEGSNLLIDETGLKPGTLDSVGVENAKLLKTLLELQKVEYDFKYYKMDMTADVQMLIFSEGKSNILPADLVVPFRPTSTGSGETVGAEILDSWRWYLATARSLHYSIDQEMQKVLEDDLVAAKQADRSLGSQDFSRWLTMGQLMSNSFGETCLSLEHWQMVKDLESLRKERILNSNA